MPYPFAGNEAHAEGIARSDPLAELGMSILGHPVPKLVEVELGGIDFVESKECQARGTVGVVEDMNEAIAFSIRAGIGTHAIVLRLGGPNPEKPYVVAEGYNRAMAVQNSQNVKEGPLCKTIWAYVFPEEALSKEQAYVLGNCINNLRGSRSTKADREMYVRNLSIQHPEKFGSMTAKEIGIPIGATESQILRIRSKLVVDDFCKRSGIQYTASPSLTFRFSGACGKGEAVFREVMRLAERYPSTVIQNELAKRANSKGGTEKIMQVLAEYEAELGEAELEVTADGEPAIKLEREVIGSDGVVNRHVRPSRRKGRKDQFASKRKALIRGLVSVKKLLGEKTTAAGIRMAGDELRKARELCVSVLRSIGGLLPEKFDAETKKLAEKLSQCLNKKPVAASDRPSHRL